MAASEASGGSGGFQARKARLRAAFLGHLPARLDEARALLADLTGPTLDAAQLEPMRLVMHTIKGSAGSFGLADIAEQASHADAAIKAHEPAMDADALIRLLADRIEALSQLATTAPAAAASTGFELPSATRTTGPATPPADADVASASVDADSAAASAGRSAETAPAVGDGNLVYLCDDDAALAELMAEQLACFGYQVEVFTALAPLRAAVRERKPAVLIMDISFPEGRNAGADTVAELTRGDGPVPPTIFVSQRDDFEARLQAVKAGGASYCPKPVNTTELVAVLDRLTCQEQPEPYRVVVVDDDPEIAQYHALILEQAGMTARATTSAQEAFDSLGERHADLVLTDMHMPNCTGPELARMLRQMPGYVGLPIIYVSSETDTNRQTSAMAAGAEGFLTKPVQPSKLVSEVALRAERMRTMRAQMVRDSLTGLLNHNTILHHLEVGLNRARRRDEPLALAMLDVDHFKQVNDRFGHPAGDQVLIALSRELRRRLRASDAVGRYGGEEFAIVLEETDLSTAAEVVNELRRDFARVLFSAGDQTFNCTFSAGVAGFPRRRSSDALVEAADAALYRAKHLGRNRVEIDGAGSSDDAGTVDR